MANYLTIVTALLLYSLLGHTNSQGDLPVTNKVPDKILNVQELNDRRGTDSSNLNVTAIRTLKGAKNLFKQSCEKNGGEGAFENADRAMDEIKECLESFVDVAELREEIETYKPTGDLDLVFKKYCRETPFLSKCVSNFAEAVDPCLDPKGKENMKVIQNIADSLLSFVCFRQGDRVALFVSANGPECLQSKQREIQQCVDTTFGPYIPALGPSLAGLVNLLPLVFGTKECTHITPFRICVLKNLEECSDVMPANIVDSIFSFISRVTQCQDLLTDRSAASASTIFSYLIFKL